MQPFAVSVSPSTLEKLRGLTLPCIQAATAGIAVPQVRQVADYSANVAALKPGGGTRKYNEINPVTTAYIRSQEDVFAPQTMDQVSDAWKSSHYSNADT